jgi:hypothetical protein
MSHVIGAGTARSGTGLNAVDQRRIMLAFISQKHDHFTYFSMQVGEPDWSKKDVLDFGGNVGNILRDPNSKGALAFTFIDPRYRAWPGEYEGDNLHWRLEREQELHPDVRIDIERFRRDVEDARWFILVNGTDLYVESDDVAEFPAHEQRTCHVFHTEDYMKALFPNARVLPPVNNEMQHCCIIRR